MLLPDSTEKPGFLLILLWLHIVPTRVTIFPSQEKGHFLLIDCKQENIRVKNEVANRIYK